MLKNYFLFVVLIMAANISTQSQTQSPKFRVEFVGNKLFSSERLLKKFNACYYDDENDSPRLSSSAVNYCLYKLRGYFQSQGYSRAEVGEAQIEKTADGLLIKIPITEGRRYRLGDIKITGTRVFTSEQLLSLLRLKKGDILDAEEMREWIGEKLEKAYADKGYIQADISGGGDTPSEGEGDGIVSLEMEIDEGICFTVGSIKIVGQQQVSEAVLKQQLLIKEGETFNRQALYDSIDNLNKLDSLAWLDRIRDIELKTDAETKTVNVIIRVKEKGRKK